MQGLLFLIASLAVVSADLEELAPPPQSSTDFFSADQRPPAPELNSFASQFPESSGNFDPQSIPQETVFQPVAPKRPHTIPRAIVKTLISGQPRFDPLNGDSHGHSSSQFKNLDHHDASYAFKYEVRDDAEAVHFGHEEQREGMDTDGKYHVLYPNGRVLVVRYKADAHGYQPILSYQ